MARAHRYSGVSKVIAAATVQTLVFPANEIEGSGVISYDILLQGAGNDLADLNRVRVLASGTKIMDASIAQLRTFVEGTHKTGDTQATTDTRLHVPLYLPDAVTRQERDSCQFPLGAQPQVEIDTLGTVAAGQAIIQFNTTDEPPLVASRFYTSVLNIAASVTNARFALQDGGIVRGIVLNTVGVNRARLVLSGREIFNLPGPQWNGLTIGNGLLATRMGESPLTIADPLFIPISAGIPAAVGSSYLELDTGAAWAGVTNELAVWSVVPVAAPGGGNGR